MADAALALVRAAGVEIGGIALRRRADRASR
jgi:hypothetical protein